MKETRIQYRVRLEVRAGKNMGYSLSDTIIRTVGSWIYQKYKRATSAKVILPWLFEGGVWQSGIPKVEVTTSRIVGGDNQETITWGLRLEHPDSDHSSRTWITEVVLDKISDEAFWVSIHNGYYLHSNFIGIEPPAPIATTPLIVSQVFGNEQLTVVSSNNPMLKVPQHLVAGEGKEFVNYLLNDDRRIPVVLVNISEGRRVDLAKLQKLVLGKAEIFLVSAADILEEMRFFWRGSWESYRCLRDSIRVYQGGINLENPNDYRRHRYFIFEDFGWETSTVFDIVAKSLMKFQDRGMNGIPETLDDIESRRRANRLREIKESTGEHSSKEYLELLEQDNEALTEEKKTFKDKLERFEKEIDNLELEKQILEEDLNKQKTLFEELNKSIVLAAKPSGSDDMRKVLSELPSKLVDLIDLVQAVFPNRLHFLQETTKSAKSTAFDDLHVAWSLLCAMATSLWELYFKDEVNGDIEQAFRTASGHNLVKTEGAMSKKNKAIIKQRQREYLGKTIEIWAHVKPNKGSKDLRVYFHVDNANKLLVIGHFGDHLDTAGTKVRKE